MPATFPGAPAPTDPKQLPLPPERPEPKPDIFAPTPIPEGLAAHREWLDAKAVEAMPAAPRRSYMTALRGIFPDGGQPREDAMLVSFTTRAPGAPTPPDAIPMPLDAATQEDALMRRIRALDEAGKSISSMRMAVAAMNPEGRPMRPGEGAPLPTRPDKPLQAALRAWTELSVAIALAGGPEDEDDLRMFCARARSGLTLEGGRFVTRPAGPVDQVVGAVDVDHAALHVERRVQGVERDQPPALEQAYTNSAIGCAIHAPLPRKRHLATSADEQAWKNCMRKRGRGTVQPHVVRSPSPQGHLRRTAECHWLPISGQWSPHISSHDDAPNERCQCPARVCSTRTSSGMS